MIGGKKDPEWVGTRTQATFYSIFKYTSISVLVLFMAQILLLMMCYGKQFFTNKYYVLDLVVVGVSLLFDVGLQIKEGVLVNVLRSWRILRIIHGLLSSMEIHDHNTQKRIDHTKADVYSELSKDSTKLHEKQADGILSRKGDKPHLEQLAIRAKELRSKMATYNADKLTFNSEATDDETGVATSAIVGMPLSDLEMAYIELHDVYLSTQTHVNSLAYKAEHMNHIYRRHSASNLPAVST
jgi:hypothetical protein